MDVDKDGRFYLDDLTTFGQETMKIVKDLRQKKLQHEIPSQINAHCTGKLWQQVFGQYMIDENALDHQGSNMLEMLMEETPKDLAEEELKFDNSVQG